MTTRLWQAMRRLLGIAAVAIAMLFVAPAAVQANPAPTLDPAQVQILAEEEDPDDGDEGGSDEGDDDDDGGKKKRWLIIGGGVGGTGVLAGLLLWYRRVKRVHTAYKVGRTGYRLYKRHRDRTNGPDDSDQPPRQ